MLPPRAAVLEQAIHDACDRAEQRMRRALEDPALILIVPYESLASAFFDCQEPEEERQWDALPSIRLQEFVIDLWHVSKRSPDVRCSDLKNAVMQRFVKKKPFKEDTFKREDITNWLKASGYKSAYYFLPDNERTPDTEFLVRECKRLQADNERLKNEVAALTENLEQYIERNPGNWPLVAAAFAKQALGDGRRNITGIIETIAAKNTYGLSESTLWEKWQEMKKAANKKSGIDLPDKE